MDTYLNAVKPTTATTTMTTTRHVFGLASTVVVSVAICIRVRRQLGAQNAVHIINHFSHARRGRHRGRKGDKQGDEMVRYIVLAVI